VAGSLFASLRLPASSSACHAVSAKKEDEAEVLKAPPAASVCAGGPRMFVLGESGSEKDARRQRLFCPVSNPGCPPVPACRKAVFCYASAQRVVERVCRRVQEAEERCGAV